MGLKSNNECPNKRQKRGRPRDSKGEGHIKMQRLERCVYKSQNARVTNSYQKVEEGHGMHFLLESSEETNPENTLVLKFWPLELQGNKFLLF